MISVKQAILSILENTKATTNVIPKPILVAKNFILAESIVADRDYPPFPRATMDGYALHGNDLQHSKDFFIIGEIFAGDNWNLPKNIPQNACVKIMTGAAVPNCFDTLIKNEDTITKDNKIQILTEKFSKGMNIAKQAEDAIKGSVLISPGCMIDDSILTIAASVGYMKLQVFNLPRVSIVSTGNEVLPQGVSPLPHQIRDSNSVTLNSMLKKFQIEPIRIWNLPDDPEILTNKFSECFDSDICIITGGVSAGDADYIPSTLKKLGVEEIFHKVSIRPGKPIWFGKNEKTLFFGLPGNPISARVTFKVFVEPCIRKFVNLERQIPIYLPIFNARNKKHNLDEYFRVKIVNENNQSYLQEIPNNGSGDFIGSLGSDGIAIHPADYSELPRNSMTEFVYW